MMMKEKIMNNSLGFAIIGSGVIGHTHAEAIRDVKGAHLVAVCDKEEEKARKLAEEFNISWCTDYRNVVEFPDVDVVNVCTPTGFHAEPAITALKAEKHVMVEKPMEINIERTEKMIRTADEAKRHLGVILQYRFLPSMQYLKKAINIGKLGSLTLGEASLKWYRSPDYFKVAPWRGTVEYDGGGALMNQGVHYIDLLLWLMGPVESVMAYTDTLLQPIEVEDTAVVILRFKSGALGVIQATTTAFPRLFDRIEIAGTKGSALVENNKLRFKYFASEDGENVGLYGSKDAGLKTAQTVSLQEPSGHTPQISDFVAAIKEDRSPAVDGREGQQALIVINAAYESARKREEVILRE
jgi:UDP-N-acetyl-2-amino-2-deoxyglucuronate dehydrogenase